MLRVMGAMLALVVSSTASAGTFVSSGAVLLFEHFEGPTPPELWAYSWDNEPGVPPAGRVTTLHVGTFKGSVAEMNALVALNNGPVVTSGPSNGHYVYFGPVVQAAGPFAAKREFYVGMDSTAVITDPFAPQSAMACIPAIPDPQIDSDCDDASVPAVNVLIWAEGF